MDSDTLSLALVAIEGPPVEGERLEIAAGHLTILELSPILLQIQADSDGVPLSVFESALRTLRYSNTREM